MIVQHLGVHQRSYRPQLFAHGQLGGFQIVDGLRVEPVLRRLTMRSPEGEVDPRAWQHPAKPESKIAESYTDSIYSRLV